MVTDTPTPDLPADIAAPSEAGDEVDLLLDLADAPVADATPAERLAHRRATLAGQRGGGGRSALVVDGSAIARKFLVQRLQALGYDAMGVADGETALPLIGRHAFAIVYLEFTLGGAIDGLTLCHAIKQFPRPPGGVAPAVVMATGQASSTNRVRGSLAGCDAYLVKPLLDADLQAALREVDPLYK